MGKVYSEMVKWNVRQIRPTASIALAVVAGLGLPVRAATYFVATNGLDTNNGSIGAPFATFSKAVSTAAAGDTIYARGGTYNLNSTLSIGTSKNGTAASPFNLLAYNNETPILDFRAQSIGSSSRGISLDANYWNISGLTVQYAGDNGIFLSGSNNTVSRCITRQNQDSGVQIASSGGRIPSNNLILNVDSYGNYDTPGTQRGENADGFAVKFRGLGAGNVLSGCRAWNNSDDGYDFWQAERGITVQNCQAFHNGIASLFIGVSGTFNGDGNGIKLGHDSGTHQLNNMLIWGNPANGIDINGNATQLEGDPPTITHGVTIYNNTAYNNGGKNFQFDEDPTTATPPANHILRNNISYIGGGQTIAAGNTTDHNTWSGGGLAAAAGDFVSLTDPVITDGIYHPLTDRTGATTPSFGTGLAMGPRQADGSMPDLGGFLRLAATSHLINAGVNVNLPFVGSAPDLGAFEYVASGNAYWGATTGGNVEPTWNWISGIAPTASTTANFNLGAASAYTVTFAGNVTHGALAVQSGAVTFNLNGNAYKATGNINIAAGSSLIIKSGVITAGTITVTSGAKLDLTSNKLIVTTPSSIGSWNGSNYTGLTKLIKDGRNNGAWNGSGIITSMSDAAGAIGLTTLAIAVAGDIGRTTHGGVSVIASDTLVMYTYDGDANLSGNIDGDDYYRIDANAGLVGGVVSYDRGDFDLNGSVDADDYFIIDRNYARQSAAFSAAPPAIVGVSSVPEPGSAMGLAVIGSWLLRQRRTRVSFLRLIDNP